jgi:uncharacterized membrane protein
MKTITICGLQVLLALVVLAAGTAMVTGADIMVRAFDGLALCSTFRLVVGSVEILAGLCLLAPRSAAAGAAVLACLTIAVMGFSMIQMASGSSDLVLAHAEAAARIHQAMVGKCDASKRELVLPLKREWNI